MSVEVSGPGIPTPIVANLTLSGSNVSGTVTVPTGSGRVFTVHAFDAAGIETYQGTATVVVLPGSNTTLSITLYPLSGGTPIVVTMSTFVLTVTPNAPTLLVGESVTLTAVVTDGAGRPVANPSIQWGSSNPVVAAVVPVGSGMTATVTAGVTGATVIVASYSGSVALVTIAVGAGSNAVTIADVAIGADHACARSTSSAVFCWGGNGSGQFGNGTNAASVGPVRIQGLSFTAITAGLQTTCGIDAADAAFCWGEGSRGQLGDGGNTARSTPAQVGAGFARISAGQQHACATTSNGAVYCWGSNDAGQLSGNTRFSAAAPVQVNNLSLRDVSSGDTFTCGVSSLNVLHCWGTYPGSSGTEVLFGLPGSGRTFAPRQVAIGTRTAAQVSSGHGGFCALSTEGEVYCLGRNTNGQVGDGSTTETTVMVRAALPNGSQASQIAVGWSHSCALSVSGVAYCWGDNSTGEVGDGTFVDALSPVRVVVPPNVTFTRIAAGNLTSCGITAGGEVYCWGLYVGSAPASGPPFVNIAKRVVFP